MNETAEDLIERAMRNIYVVPCRPCAGVGESLEGTCEHCGGSGETTVNTELPSHRNRRDHDHR